MIVQASELAPGKVIVERLVRVPPVLGQLRYPRYRDFEVRRFVVLEVDLVAPTHEAAYIRVRARRWFGEVGQQGQPHVMAPFDPSEPVEIEPVDQEDLVEIPDEGDEITKVAHQRLRGFTLGMGS